MMDHELAITLIDFIISYATTLANHPDISPLSQDKHNKVILCSLADLFMRDGEFMHAIFEPIVSDGSFSGTTMLLQALHVFADNWSNGLDAAIEAMSNAHNNTNLGGSIDTI